MGIKLYMRLDSSTNISAAGATGVVFVTCVAALVLGAEVLHRVVDFPSRVFSAWAWEWITN